jgi:O-antigen/teichoic acid export membrane protein
MNLRKNALFSIAEVLLNGLGLFFIYKTVVSTLGVSLLGVWSLVLATTAFGRLADVGISAGLARFVARELAKGEAGSPRGYIETGLLSVAAIMGVLTLVAYWPVYFALGIALHGAQLALAREIIPYALLTFWLLNINAVTAAALLGLHRADLRSISNICGMLVQVAASLVLIKGFQLKGLAWAQTAQYIVAIGLSWLFVVRVGRAIPVLPIRFEAHLFKDLLGFGTKLQIGTIANLLFEPATKIIIGHIAGTAVLGLYELAYRMVYQVRGVAITALQTLVPAFATLKESDPPALAALFRKTCRMAALVAAPLMGAVILGAPLVSLIWIGTYSADFVRLTALLALCWAINILAAPAYFLGLGTGEVNANVGGQVVTGLLSPALGLGLGLTFGPYGAVGGVVAGKIVGDLAPAYANRPGGDLRSSALLYPPNMLALAFVGLVSAVAFLLVPHLGGALDALKRLMMGS